MSERRPTPSGASKEVVALYQILNELIDPVGGGGVGDSTAANQVIQISVANAIKDILNGTTTTALATNTIRTSAASSVVIGAITVSVRNLGAANGTFDGVTLKPGEGLTYPAIKSRVYPAFAYNGIGTDFIIIESR